MAALTMVQVVAAETGDFFDVMGWHDEQYITHISELPYSPGSPAISWQQKENIKAWIDITGFRNLSRDEDKYFIMGDPAGLAIVQYDAIGKPPGYIDSIKKSVSLSQSGNNLIAVLNVKLKWFVVNCDENSCWRSYFSEKADFQDIEAIPEQFDKVLNPWINITEYNNTFEPKISINIKSTNSSRISVSYGNKSVVHSTKSYHVEQTEKGIYYANASQLEAWDIQGQGIARFADSIIINTNLSTFNYSALDIRISNLYGSVKVDPANFNISRVTYQPENIVYNPLLYGFLGIFLTLTGSAYYLIRQVIL